MKKLTVFDPAMCCSTGVCGPDPDQALIDFASDFDWLKAHGVPAERWNLANQPMAFVLNHKASAFLKAKGSDALPLILVDNEERLSGRYPTRSELSEWFGIPLTACERARELEKTTGISSAAVCGPDCGCGGKAKPASEPTLKETVDGLKFLENAPHTLFFTGKGGVGKTSVAAASAVALAGLGKRVLLVSTDPASNVSQVFGQPIGNQVTGIQSVPGLSAIEIDPQAAAAYREKLIQPIRGLLPDETVASITEQLSGACTTEIAAFDEFTGLLTDPEVTSQYDHILFDTAPTGHTLLLLDAAGAYHREVVRKMGETGSDTTPLSLLQNPDMTRVIIVTLPETTPVLEAKGLEADLRRAGITPWGYIVNDSLAAADPESPLLRKRAASELPLIREIESESPRTAIVPLQTDEPVGVEKLLALTR